MTFFVLYIAILFNISDFTPTTPIIEHSSSDTEEIKWYTWDEAYELSKTAPKKIFIDMYTNWCGWCKKMDKTTFKDPELVEYLNENFYAIKFNAEQRETIVYNDRKFEFMQAGRRGVHQLAYALLDGRLGYPAFVTLDEEFARIMISPGYKQAPQLMKELKFALEEKYMEMSFEDYMSQSD